MNIAIIGLGFVGLSLTSVLASKGYTTIGIDIDKEKTKYKKYFGFEPILMNLSNLTKKKENIFLELFKCIDKELIRSIFKEKIVKFSTLCSTG